MKNQFRQLIALAASAAVIAVTACGSEAHDDSGTSTSDVTTSTTKCIPRSGNPPAGSPIIVTAPSPVAPGETALLFGARVGAGAEVHGVRLDDGSPGLPPRPVDCVPSAATALDVLQASSLSAKAVVPSSWKPGLFAFVVENASGASAPVVVNRPRVDWIHGGPSGSIVSGATVDVYGRSFGTTPRAWLTHAGKVTALSAGAATSSDGYAATFTVPALAAGAYELYVHSGLGGPSGFSDPLAVTVAAPTPWPTTVFAVAANTHDDDGALATQITRAQENGGGIIELATGSYTLHHGVVIPAKTVLRSASGNRNDVKLEFDEAPIPFPYGFAGDGNFTIEGITVTSSTSARLLQCPTGGDFMRDPETGQPQNQPDPPCQNAKVHDVSFTLTTLRDQVSGGVRTTKPSNTVLLVMNGDDCEISDSSLIDTAGSALSIARAKRLSVMRNTLVSGTTRVPATQPMPLAGDAYGGGCGLYSVRDAAIVGNTIGPTPGLGAAGTLFIQYDAHDLYIAENTIGPNLSDYGEGFTSDSPYYPNFVGIPKAVAGRTLTLPRVLNAAGKTVFGGPANGEWTAGSSLPDSVAPTLVGNSVVVVNGTGLGQYAEVVSNTATAADGTTQVTVDRDWLVPLDSTSVVEVAVLKSRVVFARNAFHDVASGAELYAGGYDFLIDGTSGETMEGTYCNATDSMSVRSSPTDLERRFSRCYFNQWINSKMTDQVDPSYPWAKNPTGGIYRPYANGLIGVHMGLGADVIPAQRGVLAIGNIVRGNTVSDFTFGFNAVTTAGPVLAGQDNIVEQNQTKTVPVGVFVQGNLPGTLVRNNTCTSDCKTQVEE